MDTRRMRRYRGKSKKMFATVKVTTRGGSDRLPYSEM